MINKVYFSVTIFCLLLIASCSDSNQGDSRKADAKNYKLEIIDSLQFDMLTKGLKVADTDPVSGNMLIIQPRPPKAWVYNNNMSTLSEYALPVDHPESVGRFLLSGTFYEDGIALMGFMKVNLYDSDFNFEKSMRRHYGPSDLLMLGNKHIYDFKDDEGNAQLVTYFGQPQTQTPPRLEDYYNEFNLVDVVNPADSKSTRDTVFIPFGQLTADSRLRNGNSYPGLQPRFNVSDNKLYYALNYDTTLFVRSLPDGEVLNRYTIPFDEFILNLGREMGMRPQRGGPPKDTPGTIESVYHEEDFELIIYRSGLTLSEKQKYDSEAPNYRSLLKEADFPKYLILKRGNKVNDEIKLNPKVSSIDFIDDYGVFYGTQNIQNLEEEPDVFTIYKLKIVPVD